MLARARVEAEAAAIVATGAVSQAHLTVALAMADLPVDDACVHIAEMLESASPDSINSLRNLARYEVDWLYQSFEELKSNKTNFKKFLN